MQMTSGGHNAKFLQLLMQHVVGLYVDLKKDGEHKTFVLSSFVMSLYDNWMLITAAHCLNDLRDDIDAGWRIHKARMIDCLGPAARNLYPIPIELTSDNAAPICIDDKFDYGAIFLNGNQVQLLKANGIIPLDERVWEMQPERPDYFFLVGFPAQLSSSNVDSVKATATLNYIVERPEAEAHFESTLAPRFYGEIMLAEPLTHISGMSGGPIFSVKVMPDGNMKYWLHAVQSRWIEPKRLVAACLMNPLGAFLKEVADGQHKHLLDVVEPD